MEKTQTGSNEDGLYVAAGGGGQEEERERKTYRYTVELVG